MQNKHIALLLWVLLALFIGRVAGQLLVYLNPPSFLPSMEYWYSGLMPYRFLLPTQIIIIVILSKIALDISRQNGFFGTPKYRMGWWLLNFGTVYFLAMILRFVFQGLSIMVVFHWVLATFIFLTGCYHRKKPHLG